MVEIMLMSYPDLTLYNWLLQCIEYNDALKDDDDNKLRSMCSCHVHACLQHDLWSPHVTFLVLRLSDNVLRIDALFKRYGLIKTFVLQTHMHDKCILHQGKGISSYKGISETVMCNMDALVDQNEGATDICLCESFFR